MQARVNSVNLNQIITFESFDTIIVCQIAIHLTTFYTTNYNINWTCFYVVAGPNFYKIMYSVPKDYFSLKKHTVNSVVHKPRRPAISPVTSEISAGYFFG